MVTWILEQDVFSEKCFSEMIHFLKTNNLPYHIIKIVPFIHELDGKVPNVDGNVVAYGSIGIQKACIKYGWNPGIWTNDNFEYEVYAKNIPNMILNPEAIRMPISKVSDHLLTLDDDLFFIKPNGDTKEFAGQLMDKNEFNDWYKKMISIGYLSENDFDIVISAPKKLGREWRLAMVDGKVAGFSQYKAYGKVMPKLDMPTELMPIAENLDKQFRPADVYIIDFAETDDGYKVIEYNTFNSAGLYAMDIPVLMSAINRFVDGD